MSAMGALLAASLAANAALIHASHGYFKQLNAVRLDPPGLDFYRTAPAPDAARPAVVFFGDSRALMWTLPTGIDPYQAVNRGVGNQTTAQLLLRFQADVPKLRPAVIVLEGGVNDLKTIPDFPERRNEIVERCKANLGRLVELSRDTGARVVVVSVFDLGYVPLWRRPFWSDDVAAAVREVNAWLPSLTGDRVVYFDAGRVLDQRNTVKPGYQLDYLHLAPSGYAALNERLTPLLRSLPR